MEPRRSCRLLTMVDTKLVLCRHYHSRLHLWAALHWQVFIYLLETLVTLWVPMNRLQYVLSIMSARAHPTLVLHWGIAGVMNGISLPHVSVVLRMELGIWFTWVVNLIDTLLW